jgi:catechol 2,3-dioxygenase-like lactoylglutathione lyase family enzyme
MFDHISLKVADFDACLAFYSAALAPLGFEAEYVDKDGKSAGFGPRGKPGLWIAEGKSKGGVHIAFRSPKRAAVDHFYDAAMRSGGKDNGKPGIRADYTPTYYAAFVIDPDGNNIEAVTHTAEP